MLTLWNAIRKMSAAAFAVLFLLGQFHMCQSAYELPSGAECMICPNLEHQEDSNRHGAQVSAKHNDCHDCCTIGTCENPKPPSSSLTPSTFQLFAIAILPDPIQVWVPAPPSGSIMGAWQSGAPPTGPPSLASARAPPRLA